jgi:hypothetical protein
VRYSQPYGLPEIPAIPTPNPPDGSGFSRYVNGNPVVGTAGSIPPNTAFDEDQIEIVNVIINAGLTPNHAELDQLWQALMALFAQRYITTHVVKTVHGAGADFPDLNEAMKWLGQYIITPTGYVTFMLAPGKWDYITSVEINHPNANRISIQASALLGGTPQPGNLSVTGYHSSADGSNQIIYLRSVHATELSFTNGVNGFVIMRPGLTIRYLLITGSQTEAPATAIPQGNGIYQLADVNFDGCSIWGFGRVGLAINQYVCRMITSLSLVVAYCGWQGMTVDGGQFLASSNSYVILVSNAISGLTNFGGWCWMDQVSVRGHGPPTGNAAVHCEQGGFIACSAGSDFSINQNAVIIAGAATWIGEYCTYLNNAQSGLYANGTATCWVDYSTFSGNGNEDIIASLGAMVEAVGCTFELTSPPVNQVGNIEAYIWL